MAETESTAESSSSGGLASAVMECRDPAFGAVCWFLHSLDPASEALVTVANPRDGTRKVIFQAAARHGAVTYRGLGYPVRVEYAVDTSDPLSTDGRPEPFRRVRMRGPRPAIESMVRTAIRDHRAFVVASGTSSDDAVATWVWDDRSGTWGRGRARPPRPMSTLFLPPDAGDLACDFRHFISRESLARYEELHVSPTRIYMLHGTPGSGKSSLVHCLASDSGFGIATVSFGPSTTDADLAVALESLPPRCVACIEDVDCMFDGRQSRGGPSFAGVLAALDNCGGQDPGSAVAVFLTTNRLCSLDPALRRRVDYVLEFGCATRAQAQRMFARFFPFHSFEPFWERVRLKKFSMSVLEKYLLKCMWAKDPLHSIADFDVLASVAASDKDTGHMFS